MGFAFTNRGGDNFTARVIDPNGPSLTKFNSVRSNKGKVSRRLMSVLLMAVIPAMSVVGLMSTTQKDADANWLSDMLCGPDAYFNEPVGWQNGMTALTAFVGGAPNPLANEAKNKFSSQQSGDADFLNSRHTAYEKYGMSGTTWTVYRGESNPDGSDDDLGKENEYRIPDGEENVDRRKNTRCNPVIEVSSTWFANQLFSGTKFFTSVSGWVITQAYEPLWLNDLNDKVATVITGEPGKPGLRDTFYFEFVNLAVILGALYIAYIGLVKRKTTEAVSSVGWMAGALLVGGLFVYNPALIPSISNNLTSTISDALLIGTAGATDDQPNTPTNLCYTDPGATPSNSSPAEAMKVKRDHIVLGINCSLWRTFVYEPWAVGQFGVSPESLYGQLNTNAATAAPGVDLGGGTIINNWALYQIEQQSIDKYALSQLAYSPPETNALTAEQIKGMYLAQPRPRTVLDEKHDNWYRVVDAVASPLGEQSLYTNWSGGNTTSRIEIAQASLVASFAAIIIVVVLAFSMLAYSLGATMLIFFGAIFMLIGVHPGTGRRIALKWLELYVASILKKIMAAAMLGMVLMFYGALLNSTTTTGVGSWTTSVLGIIAITVAALIYRDEIMTIANVNFGGYGFSPDKANRSGSAVAGAVGGAAVGFAMAGKGGMKAASAVMSSGEGTTRQRLTSATSAMAKATGKGAVKGASKGGRAGYYSPSNRSGIAAGAIAGRFAGSNEGEGVHNEHQQYRNEAERRTAQRAQEEQQIQEEQTRLQYEEQIATESQERYEHDYEKMHNSDGWKQAFFARYGFMAPDPKVTTFTGYGRAPQANPEQMPRKRSADNPYVKKHVEESSEPTLDLNINLSSKRPPSPPGNANIDSKSLAELQKSAADAARRHSSGGLPRPDGR